LRRAFVALFLVASFALVMAVPGLDAARPTVPSPPTLTAVAGSAGVSLQWTTPADNGRAIQGYDVYRASGTGGLTLLVKVGLVNEYLDAAVVAGVTYRYAVSAENRAGEGPLSPSLSASLPIPAVTARGRIVFTFDDGYISALDAAGILERYGDRGTFYITTGFLTSGPKADYLSAADVTSLSSRGEDIEAHTVTHPDLRTISDAQLRTELADPKQTLEGLTGKPVVHFAYPFDSYDARVIAATRLVYKTARTVDGDVGNKDPYHVPGSPVGADTSLATVEGYVTKAILGNDTLVLVFHRITTTPLAYDWTPAQFDALLSFVHAKGTRVSTIAQTY
jgi:peptidoglycan/xylan/chitin deacetylase (PgdA/CDA1 family)